MENPIILEEVNSLIKSFDNIRHSHPEYYLELKDSYTSISSELENEFSNNPLEQEKDIIKYKVRTALLKNNSADKRNFFTITSKDDFSSLPTGTVNLNWGQSICYTPLNNHSRKHLKKGDVVFCYRQGQFGDLNEALNTRGIYGIGIAASDPKELFEDKAGHNRWAVEICFPVPFVRHLELRNIQMHPETISLTPYNGNRNDALQHIDKASKYETLLNLILSKNIELKKYFEIIFHEYNLKEIILPEILANTIYNETNYEPPTIKNPIIEQFIEWTKEASNYKKSYDGIIYNPILDSWDQIFFNGKLFHLNFADPINSIKRIKKLINDEANIPWNAFKETNHGSPKAILGKNNYWQFLEELIENESKMKDLAVLYKNFIKNKTEALAHTNNEEQLEVEKIILTNCEPNNIEDSVSRNLILYGAPGTGKSFELNKRVKKAFPSKELRTRITFHPNYSYKSFFGSYKPKPIYLETANKTFEADRVTLNSHQMEPVIEYVFEPGPFLEMFVKAYHNPEYNFVIVIEEINRANTAAVFGSIFQLLDRDESGKSTYPISLDKSACDFLMGRKIDGNYMTIPSNLYIWATMNNADQGVLPMDSAFKRRWSFEHLRLNEYENEVKDLEIKFPWGVKVQWNIFRRTINDQLKNLKIHEDKFIGPFFMSKSEINDNKAVLNKLLLYLKEDVLRYKSGIFSDKLKTFSEISEEYINGSNVFSESISFEE